MFPPTPLLENEPEQPRPAPARPAPHILYGALLVAGVYASALFLSVSSTWYTQAQLHRRRQREFFNLSRTNC